MKKPYYSVCKVCGATLDPGERCDCQSLETNLPKKQPPLKSSEGENHHGKLLGCK